MGGVGDAERGVEDGEAIAHEVVGAVARRHDVDAVGCRQRPHPVRLAVGDDCGDRGRCRRLARRLIGDELDRPEHAEPADLSDARMTFGDVAQRGADDVVAEVTGLCEHTFLLEDADARHSRRARQRMP